MKLTFANDLGQTFSLEIDSGMELENVMALLEAETGIPVSEQAIHFRDQELPDPKKTMSEYGIPDDAVLILRRKVASVGGRALEQDAEMMRLQLLGDPRLMSQMQRELPELAEAAQHDPSRFADLLRRTRERQHEAELQHQQELQRLNDDPFDVEAQKKIEEHIRQEAVLENMQHALEYSPESFGRVHMLYIPVEVNSCPVKAFVDSGAQQTIMSPSCAERCGIMRLVDKRFSGIARGVGIAMILGRVHSAQLKLADLYLPCSFTIMEGRDVDLLFGLDMLKAHQACIDLEKDVLRIQGREVKFLPEHELPLSAQDIDPEALASGSTPSVGTGGASGNPGGGSTSGPSFPGSGRTLGSNPAVTGRPSSLPQQASTPQSSRHSEVSVKTLMDLGASRAQAISLLDAAGGNVDVAASLMF